MKRRYVIFDRDGTLIEHVHHLVDVNRVRVFPDIVPGLKDILKKNYRLGIITNQSVIERGLASDEVVQLIHQKILEDLSGHNISIDFILYCPHLPETGCECRKPKPGLGIRAIDEHHIDAKFSFMVGDQESDIQFGKNLGFSTIAIRNSSLIDTTCDYYCENMSEVAALLPE